VKYLALVALFACATHEHKLSASERAALDEFRRVERDCLAKAEVVLNDLETEVSTDLSLRDVTGPWNKMHEHVVSTKFEDRELDAALRKYLDDRDTAFTELAGALNYFVPEFEQHYAEYPGKAEIANASRAKLETLLAKYKLPPLPPVPTEPAVTFVPPPAAPPGAAFLRVGDNVVLFDEHGARVIATDVRTMDVRADGTMWACGLWNLAHWDGKTATTMKSKVFADGVCAAGPDGRVWVLGEDLDNKGKDQLATFDGKSWTVTTASVGSPFRRVEQLIVDDGGKIYALDRDHSGGGDEIFVFEGRAWKPVETPKSVSTPWFEHLFRGADGKPYLITQITKTEHEYPLAVFAIGQTEPQYVDADTQVGDVEAVADTAGVVTAFDRKRHVIVQGKLRRKLPAPDVSKYSNRESPGPFAFDASGRIWVDLVDGLSVIEPDGKRTIFPHGSIDVLREPIRQIVVVGAGPKLPAPNAAVTRTITGTIKGAQNVPLAICTGRDAPCAKRLQHWETTTDPEGKFEFKNVPVYDFPVYGQVGERGKRFWQSVNAHCCGEKADLGEVSFNRPAVY
jgi:hypothetical protein